MFQWIPSHCDILGNDTVDTLANEGRLLDDITYPLELCELKNSTKKQMLWKWQQYWNTEKQNSNYGLLKPNIGDWPWCRSNSRHLDVIMTKLRLEKIKLNKYLNKIGLSPTDLCTQCNSGEVEDTEHFLLTCQKYSAPRNKLILSLQNLGIVRVTLHVLLGAANVDTETKHKITRELEAFIKATNRDNL